MINKKGEMTAEQLLKLVLAILGILALLFLGISIYSVLIDKQKLEQAKAATSDIINLEKDVISGKDQEYLLIGPKKWFILGKEKGYNSQCLHNSCLCICEENDCAGKSFYCREIELEHVIIYAKSEKNYIEVDKVPLKLILSKSGRSLNVQEK